MLKEFFRFCLRLTTGKNGRKLPGIGKLSTLGQDWKSFLRYYEGATKVPLDTELGLRMNKVSADESPLLLISAIRLILIWVAVAEIGQGIRAGRPRA
jgi:hypothetical protein